MERQWILTIAGAITTTIGLTTYTFLKPEIIGTIITLTGLALIVSASILDYLRNR